MQGSILCIEDDRSLCQILAKALGGEGYRVRTAFDGEEALVRLAESTPDLVLLDLILPRRDGFSVLEGIRGQAGPAGAVPVILISGSSATPEYERRAVALGAADLLTKPVPLEQLLRVVDRQLGEAKTPVPARTPARPGEAAGRRPPDALSGTLDRLPFPALLHHLHGLRATGFLQLESGRKRKWIQFRDGYPVAVRGNLVNETLGNLLVRRGRVSAADAAESRRRMKRGQLQGEVLVAMEALTEQELALALRAQAEQKLYEVFTWESGSFHFEIGGLLQRANALPVEASPANILFRGVARRMPTHVIDALSEANPGAFVAPAESAFYRYQEIELDAAQRRLLQSFDGTQPLASFRAAEEPLRRTLYGLVAAGLLQLRGGRPPQPERVLERRDTGPTARPEAARPAPAPPARQPAAAGATRAAEPPEAPGPAGDDSELRARLAATLERFRGQNHFEILGVDASAGEQEIHAAYVRLAERAHPDRVLASSQAARRLAAEVFTALERAHEVLVDPRQRQAYRLELRRAERESAEREEGRKALEAEVQFQKGEAALRQRDYPQALLHFGRSLELFPQEGEYHAHYGWALHLCHPEEQRITQEALEHVRRGIKLAGDREKPYLFMGRLCKAMGRTDVAEKMFNRAVQVQAGCAEAMSELRLIHLRREKQKGLIGRLLRR